MDYEVTITVKVIADSGDEDDKNELKNDAWFTMFNDNDPSNWPEGTTFTFRKLEEQDG